MEPELQATLEAIHASPCQAVVVCAGAGGQAIEQLVALPGSSRTVLEAVIPYSRRAFAAFLGREPEQFTTAEVCRELADRAYERACRWADPATRPLGVACTATLATTRPKRGAHRAFIVVRSEREVVTYGVTLTKGARDRAGEEQVVSALLLAALAEACEVLDCGLRIADCGLPTNDERRTTNDDGPPRDAQSLRESVPQSAIRNPQSAIPGLLPEERVTVERRAVVSPLGRLLGGEVGAVLVGPDGQVQVEFPPPAAVFPGAFHPLHAGHLGLARAAARRLGVPVTFEISATNVDKPALSEPEIRRRLAQFAWRYPAVVSDAPTFVRKARLFPRCTFVIGADTLERLFAPRYYGGEEAMLAAISEIQAQGCRFLVAGRFYQGDYHAPDRLPIPPRFREMFDFLSEEEFRVDLSSTELRGPEGE